MVVYLRNLGHWVNRKRVQRLMGVLGLAGIDYYPGTREELVEDALRKIASRQSSGFMQQKPSEASGVLFSLYELMAELAET